MRAAHARAVLPHRHHEHSERLLVSAFSEKGRVKLLRVLLEDGCGWMRKSVATQVQEVRSPQETTSSDRTAPSIGAAVDRWRQPRAQAQTRTRGGCRHELSEVLLACLTVLFRAVMSATCATTGTARLGPISCQLSCVTLLMSSTNLLCAACRSSGLRHASARAAGHG